MSVPLPKQKEYFTVEENIYSEEQLLEYSQACRAAALEEAALVCESEYDNWDNERPLRICATAIRNLK